MTQLIGRLKQLSSTSWKWRRDLRRRIRRFNRLEVRQRCRGEVEPGEPMCTKHPLAYEHPASRAWKRIQAERAHYAKFLLNWAYRAALSAAVEPVPWWLFRKGVVSYRFESAEATT